MNYHTVEISHVPFDTLVRVKDHFGKEHELAFTDKEANTYVKNLPSDYYVIDKREEPPTKQYVRDFRLSL